MQTQMKIDTRAFNGLLNETLINNSAQGNTSIYPPIELIKGKMTPLALSFFDPEKKELQLNPQEKFGQIFSQDIYGAGFTKGLANILSYLVCLEEENELVQNDPKVKAFATKVKGVADDVLSRLSLGQRSLADVRKSSEELDNFGGYYDRTGLNHEVASELLPKGILKSSLEIDAKSGHLIVKLDSDFYSQLLEAYRSEIESHLSEEGKSHLQLPDNIGFVVVAYKDELAKLTPGSLENILSLNPYVSLNFNTPYVVPVRGDYRYSLVAAILVESEDITNIRNGIGLQPLYSQGRPLRFTFGAVRNEASPVDDEVVVARLRSNKSLAPWFNWIENRA